MASRSSAEKNFQKSYFDVLGICCPSEVPMIENILKSLDGVEDVTVIVPTKTVVVYHDSLLTSQLQIVKALNKARLEASIKVKGVNSVPKKWPSPFAVASGACLLVSLFKFFFHPLLWVPLAAVGFGIIPILLKAFAAIRNLTFGDINILVVITVVGSIVLKDYLEAGTIVFLFVIADWLESLASHEATAAMSSLLNLVPQRAILAETGEEVAVSEVKINTIVAVKDGEIIPIDGVVVEGNCEVDEKTLTGESFPVNKQKDSTVWAGTINVNGYISVRTTALAEDCMVARMTKLVEEAQSKKSRTQRSLEKFAKYYTPGIVLISAALAIVPASLRLHNQKKWYHIALVVLVSACPCALILSTPVAMFCALTKAAKIGVFFKGADYLETLARVKLMAFDKTGTITRAEFEVTEFRSLVDDVSLSTLIYWVSSIESKSSHPMAAALMDLAQSQSVEPKPEEVEQFQNFPGEGIYGKIDGKEIYIGNSKISSRAGCQLVPKLEGNLDEGKSVGYVFSGSTPAGIFYLADVCRTGAKEALKELKSMGIKSVMITGDCYAAAKHAQDQLGGALEVVHADLLPEDKARIVKDFQKQACTAMIGDGINDAPALATADVGISMGVSGSQLATETGHVILMTNDIQRIPEVANLARKARRKIHENIIFSVATKSLILGLAIAGHPIVWAAVLADVGTCLLVILNSMLLLRGMPRYRRKFCKSSAAPRDNKQKQKFSGSDLLHSRQTCCQDMKSKKDCEATTCSSKHCDPCCQEMKSKKDCQATTCSSKHCDPCCQEMKSKKDCEATTCSSKHSDPCCQDMKSKKDCEPTTCFSKHCDPLPRHQYVPLDSISSSCGSGQSSESTNEHNCCGHDIRIRKTKYSDRGSCNTGNLMGGSKAHHHGVCSNSTKTLGDDSGAYEILKHCHHEKHSITSSNDRSSSFSDIGISQLNSNGKVEANDQKDNLIIDEELGTMVSFCCNHVAKCEPPNQSKAKNHVSECEPRNHSAAHILEGHNHVDCGTICKALEKRHAGGCCESFRKECCIHGGHLGAHLRGGLSEIVIE